MNSAYKEFHKIGLCIERLRDCSNTCSALEECKTKIGRHLNSPCLGFFALSYIGTSAVTITQPMHIRVYKVVADHNDLLKVR